MRATAAFWGHPASSQASPALKEALERPSQAATPAPPATSLAGSATTTHGTGDVQLPEKTLPQKSATAYARKSPIINRQESTL